VLDLIDLKHTGILAILDEQCIVPQSSDRKFTRYLYSKCGDHKRFIATSAQRVSYLFSIKHYAGEVEYSTDNWLEKNKDELPGGSADLIMKSDFSFMTKDLKEFFRLEQPKNSTRKSKNSLITKSVGAQFAEQLRTLRSRIDQTVPHYIRCLKPNDELVPDYFEPKNVVEQLRCGGVLEAVRVSRAGYPTRYAHEVFLARYNTLLEEGNNNHANDAESVISGWSNFGSYEEHLKKLVAKIAFEIWKELYMVSLKEAPIEKKPIKPVGRSYLNDISTIKNTSKPKTPAFRTLAVESTIMGPEFKGRTNSNANSSNMNGESGPKTEKQFLNLDFPTRCGLAGLQLGKTKVFLRREAFEQIEAMRSRRFYNAAATIQAMGRGYLYRQRYSKMKSASILLQSVVRMHLVLKKKNLLALTQKVIRIQSVWRRAVIRHTVWSCYLEIKNAAVTIQRAVRHKNASTSWEEEEEDVDDGENDEYTNGAIVLQSWFRGMIIRAEVSKTIMSIVKIQALFRGAKARFKVLDTSDEENKKAILKARLTQVKKTGASPRRTDMEKIPFKVNPNVAVKKTALYQLIQDENWASVESTLDQHPKLAEAVEPSSGELPLHILARHKTAWTLLIDMVVVLYPKALVHRDRMGALPIHHAAAHDNVAALEILHSAYKDGINESDSQGRLPVHVAAEFDAVDAVKYLLAKAPEGAYTSIQSSKAVDGGGLPLHAACRHNVSIGVITAFLAENFASAKKTDDNGNLPLHLLLRCGESVDQVVVKTLLTCFSTAISRTDMYGDLPLSIALKSGCKSSVINTILIQYPSAASISDSDGHSPLFLAFLHGAEDRTILGLLNHAPEVSQILHFVALLYLLSSGPKETCSLLLEARNYKRRKDKNASYTDSNGKRKFSIYCTQFVA